MDPSPIVIPLQAAAEYGESAVGGKAAKLARLIEAGYRVPRGFVITVEAYKRFLRAGGLAKVIQMEIGRKPLSRMRWEEIWDAALRIRRSFLAAPIPSAVSHAILSERSILRGPLAVRSSAPGEDSAARSYAGLHESLIGVSGESAMLDALRVVWASLWSDAALLYRRELGLDPLHSTMAIVVQEVVTAEVSGVAFGRDPRDMKKDHEIVEAVPGPCSNLVDGLVDPDRWIITRASGEILEWRPGSREEGAKQIPLLDTDALESLHKTLQHVESLFGWAADVEWTAAADQLTLLQSRPVTGSKGPGEGDEREWYLTLRPGMAQLSSLCKKVTEELIPQLQAEANRLAGEKLEGMGDGVLADAIDARFQATEKWRRIYREEFIPFAHGVRQLAVYYNDAVKPEDPYEFVGLLRGQPMIALKRNEALLRLAERMRRNDSLREAVLRMRSSEHVTSLLEWRDAARGLEAVPGGAEFSSEFESVLQAFMGVAYDGERLDNRPDLVLQAVLELSGDPGQGSREADAAPPTPGRHGARPREFQVAVAGRNTVQAPSQHSAKDLESRLLEAVGTDREEEALAVLEIARLSWRLRDDDNILIGRLEHQLLQALEIGAARLRFSGRLDAGVRIAENAAPIVAAALRDPDGAKVAILTESIAGTDSRNLAKSESVTRSRGGAKFKKGVEVMEGTESTGPDESAARSTGETARQIVGQPAAPGIATGVARVVNKPEDLGRFHAGEVLVCDAIQPTMSHLVPLARAIVERRGGMLIHGAIIARELGIPCVNGLPGIAELLSDGDLVTVDGYLGIVTVGPPEFDLERTG